jgi:hypothetical protein
VIVAAVLTVRTTIADSLAISPQTTRNLGTVRVTAPASWVLTENMLIDADLYALIEAHREAASGPLTARLDAYAKEEPDRAKKRSFDHVEPAKDQLVPLPHGWQGHELLVSIGDPVGGRQRYRVVVAARADATGHVLASVYAPVTVAKAAPSFFTSLLASVQ